MGVPMHLGELGVTASLSYTASTRPTQATGDHILCVCMCAYEYVYTYYILQKIIHIISSI